MKATSSAVKEAIGRKFAAPEYATFYEVANGTGARGNRYADALSMSLFPSRGLLLHGFEVKVSRTDWLNELKDPHKADAIQRYCDRWWIVTPPDIIRLGELPPTWGHYVLKGSGLHCEVKAPALDRQEWQPEFMAAVLRRAHEALARDLNAAVAKESESLRIRIRKEAEDTTRREIESYQNVNGTAARALARLMDECGLDSGRDRYFDSEAFAKAVGYVHRLGIAGSYSSLRGAANQARIFAASADEVLAVADQQEEAA